MTADPPDPDGRCAAAVVCAWCGARAVPIPVHGHLQCARCGTNIDPCCGGEIAEADERTSE